MNVYRNIFDETIATENLLNAWQDFKSGKQKKPDVLSFEWNLEANILALHRDLKYNRYKHQAYLGFHIQDPKHRHIHKACVRDRIVHHAVYRIVAPLFEETFITTSFSCRKNMGTHKGVLILKTMLNTVSRSNTRPCFALKCDVAKFFDSVDHTILKRIIGTRIKDKEMIGLIDTIVDSYESSKSTLFEKKGLPLGNLTSQLFANIYMNEFDQWIKHTLEIKHYARYTDDFVIISEDQNYLESLIPLMQNFLGRMLCLELHPKKVTIRKYKQGIDFLGYVVLPHNFALRTKTKQRMFKKLKHKVIDYKKGQITRVSLEQSYQSYLGVLSHADTFKLQNALTKQFLSWIGIKNEPPA